MNNPGEISSIIKSQIENYKSRVEMTETGKVILVGDGIARVYGLSNCMANELLEFEDGSFGMAQNLEEESVSVAILSNKNNFTRGCDGKKNGQSSVRSSGRKTLGQGCQRSG